MIKEGFLKPFEKKVPIRNNMDIYVNVALTFLKSLSDEEITSMGNCLFLLYPNEIIEATRKSENRTGANYDFIDSFRKEYKISDKLTIADRKKSKYLTKKLEEFKGSISEEEIEKIKNSMKEMNKWLKEKGWLKD